MTEVREPGDADAVWWPEQDRVVRDAEAALRALGRVVVSGPWGTGKSYVVRALARRTGAAEGIRCLPLAGSRQLEREPYGLLAQLVGMLPASLEAAPLVDLRPELREANPPAVAHAARALRQLCLDDGAEGWTILIDDAHLADHLSLGVMDFCCRTLPASRLRVAFTLPSAHCVSGEQNAALGGGHAPWVELRMLTEAEVAAALVTQGISAGHAASVHRDSGGHPLLARAAASSLSTERGPTTEPARLAQAWWQSVPSSWRGTLTALSLTRSADAALFCACGYADAERDVDRADRAGLITRGPSGTVTFASELLRQQAEFAISPTERATLHHALAAATPDPLAAARHRLLATAGPDEQTAQDGVAAARTARSCAEPGLAAELMHLAARRTAAGDRPLLLERWLQACRDAADAGDGDLASRVVAALTRLRAPDAEAEALLALLEAHGQGLENQSATLARLAALTRSHPSLRARLGLCAAIRHNIAGRPQESLAAAEQAARDARSCARPDIEAAALTMQARIERLIRCGDAKATLTRALTVSPGLPSGQLRYSPHYLRLRHALYDDDHPTAQSGLHHLLGHAEATGSAEDLQEIWRSLAESDLRRGHVAAAEGWSRRALHLARTLHLSPGPACATHALVQVERDGAGPAAATARWGLQQSKEEEDSIFTARNLYALAHALLCLHQFEAAAAALSEVADLEQQQHTADLAAFKWHHLYADALTLADRPDQAEHFLTELAAEHPQPAPVVTAALLRSRARIDLHHHRTDQAADRLTEAALAFDASHLPLEHAHTLVLLGQAEQKRRRAAAARRHREHAHDLYTQAQATYRAERTHHLLHRLDRTTPTGPGQDLTQVEADIARQVASGASNREVANTLFISVKTVEAHLSRIYRKLSLTSRTQLALRMRT
ncbi:LuxR C-terminal-related transcriptional regulator [Streptomyces sp. NPDC051214]|uniref:helix-turn-helix transcriptional regulator n=1 Tax=Streptomyces sp. NPDC051214 TaxID=3155282 RepID=UPI00341C4C30